MHYSAGCGELCGGDWQTPAIGIGLGGVPVGCVPHAGPHPVAPGEPWGCRWQQRLRDGKAQSGLVSPAHGRWPELCKAMGRERVFTPLLGLRRRFALWTEGR